MQALILLMSATR